jgi:hypothetical protein
MRPPAKAVRDAPASLLGTTGASSAAPVAISVTASALRNVFG